MTVSTSRFWSRGTDGARPRAHVQGAASVTHKERNPLSTTATAETIGKLARTPLVEVLATLLARRATGSLVLVEPSGRRSALYVHLGVVVKARTPHVTTAGPTPSEVVAQQVEWAADRIGSTLFGYYPDIDFMVDVSVAPTDPLALIWRCARRSTHAALVERFVVRLGDRPLALHPRARLDLFAFGWDDLAVLDLVRTSAASAPELLARQPRERLHLQRLIYTLALCRHLDVGDGKSPIGVEDAGPVVPGLSKFASSYPDATVVREAMPPPRTAPPQRTISGLVHRAPSVSPLPAPAWPPRGDGSSAVTSRPPSAAVRPPSPVLTSRPPSIVTSRSRLPPPSSTLASVPPRSGRSVAIDSQDTNELLARAEGFARQGDFDKALRFAMRAGASRAAEAAQRAFVGYLELRCGRFDESETERFLDLCREALHEQPESADLRFYRGWAFKVLGRENDAQRDFVRVVRADPNNIDAAREVHLYHRRREREGSSGFMGMLRRSLTPSAVHNPSSRAPKR